jgi:hypothetical protein
MASYLARRRLGSFFIGGMALILAVLGVSSGCGGNTVKVRFPDFPNLDRFEIRGDWRGRLHQQGLPPFTLEATIRSPQKARENTAHYTGIDCSGHWSFLGINGKTYRFREVIDRGKGGTCKGVGTVTLTLHGDEARYVFRGGGVVSRGVLHRVGLPTN